MREGVARQSVEKPPRNAQMGGGRAEKPRETRESTARRGGKATRDTRKHGGCGKAPRNARMGGMAARKSPARHAKARWSGGSAEKPRETTQMGGEARKNAAKRAKARRGGAKKPPARRTNGRCSGARKISRKTTRMGGRRKSPREPREWAARRRGAARKAPRETRGRATKRRKSPLPRNARKRANECVFTPFRTRRAAAPPGPCAC